MLVVRAGLNALGIKGYSESRIKGHPESGIEGPISFGFNRAKDIKLQITTEVLAKIPVQFAWKLNTFLDCRYADVLRWRSSHPSDF